MTATTHIGAGLSIGIGISILTASPLSAAVATTTAAVAGSLLPDIDTASSKLGRQIAPVSWLIRIVFGHRQMFHSLTFWLIACVGLIIAIPSVLPLILSGAAGVLSHLLLDMLNPSGIALFWPLSKRYYFARLQCRGVIDYLLTVAFAVVVTALGWYYCHTLGLF